MMDPVGIAEDIVRERSEVTRQWRKAMNEISEEHVGLQRLLLTKRMLDSVSESIGPIIFEHTTLEEGTVVQQPKQTTADVDDLSEAGVFE